MENTIYTPRKLWLAKSDIDDICRPLKQFDISYFAHEHIDEKGNTSGLSNNPGYSEQYVRNRYYNADIHMAEKHVFGNIVLWDAIDVSGETKKPIKTAEEFGIKHTFTIIEHSKNSSDFYHFATHLDNNVINQTYLANVDLLKLFILHFKEKITQSKSLSSIYDLTFSPDREFEGFTTVSNTDNCNNKNNRSKFIRNLSVKFDLFHLNSTNMGTLNENLMPFKLSKREIECLMLTILGKRAKQISFELGLSRRTVEDYIENAKVKMDVYSKADLVDKAIQLIRKGYI